jgi:hypothetical protein
MIELTNSIPFNLAIPEVKIVKPTAKKRPKSKIKKVKETK